MPPTEAPDVSRREEKKSEKFAREFVRWCFSFGADFRNTPDVVNLRNWAQKTRLKIMNSEETEILIESRRLYLKRIESMMKKSDRPVLGTGPEIEESVS